MKINFDFNKELSVEEFLKFIDSDSYKRVQYSALNDFIRRKGEIDGISFGISILNRDRVEYEEIEFSPTKEPKDIMDIAYKYIYDNIDGITIFIKLRS